MTTFEKTILEIKQHLEDAERKALSLLRAETAIDREVKIERELERLKSHLNSCIESAEYLQKLNQEFPK
jgi:hypothetical protein